MADSFLLHSAHKAEEKKTNRHIGSLYLVNFVNVVDVNYKEREGNRVHSLKTLV